jgi:RHS repeat-associated protein
MGSAVKQNASYGYDRSSNRQWRRDDLAHDLGGVEATRHDNFYGYDGLYQVKERKLGNLIGTAPAYTGIDNLQQTEDWCYDATGNWQRYGNADESLLQARTHNAANEITAVTNPSGVIQPAYDKVGNQTADIAPGDWDRQFDLTWDAWNRLIQVKHSSTVIQTNAYDGLSRRITSSDGTDTVHYYYDPSWRAVEEYLNSDPAPERRYLWGLRSRWDLVKRERDDTGSLDEKRYVLYDAMDPVAICNASGTVTQRFEYSPFGETSFIDANFAPDTTPGDWNWLFHGEFRDHDTGYYNYGFRFYNSTTGRWASRDPIGERGGLNLYGFVQNNGANISDYVGLNDNNQRNSEEPCCCFVEKIYIDKFEKIKERIPEHRRFGHEFDVKIELSYKKSSEFKDCKLEWWERSSNPASMPWLINPTPDVWDDKVPRMGNNMPSMFDDWKRRGPEHTNVTITDPPHLGAMPLGEKF